MHCLYGSKVDTVEKFVHYVFEIYMYICVYVNVYKIKDLKFKYRLYYKGTDISGYPQLISGDGDGTVNIRSLEACMHWQKSQKQKVYHQGFPGVDHTEILRNRDILVYINSVLLKV